MCFSSGGGGPDNSIAIAQAQITAQQQIADQNATLQQNIADQQAQQSQEALDYQKSQDAQRQAEADTTAQVQANYDSNRSQLASQYTDAGSARPLRRTTTIITTSMPATMPLPCSPKSTGSTPKRTARWSLVLPAAGNWNSQAHADLQGSLDQARGRAMTDLATNASQAAQTLKSQVGQTQNSLLTQILSTGALGQPVSPATPDAMQAAIDNTNRSLQGRLAR